jgi:hypothetical protein
MTPLARFGFAAVAVPIVVATLAAVGYGAAARTRWGSIDTAPRNSAEAAAVGNAAALLRFIHSGDNPTRVHPLRPHIVSSRLLFATTLEAAVTSRRLEMVRLLDREGVIVGADDRLFLACLASDLHASDVADYLAPSRAPCAEGASLARVFARTAVAGDD